MTPADLLDAGADYIDEKGWWNGDYLAVAKWAGGTCMVLSLSRSCLRVEDRDLWEEAVEVLRRHLGMEHDTARRLDELYEWNDSHSHVEVVEAMRKAAQEWRNDH